MSNPRVDHSPIVGRKPPTLPERTRFGVFFSESSARIMGIATHTYVTGVPHGIAYFERLIDYLQSREGVIFVTGGEILDWYRAATEEAKL